MAVGTDTASQCSSAHCLDIAECWQEFRRWGPLNLDGDAARRPRKPPIIALILRYGCHIRSSIHDPDGNNHDYVWLYQYVALGQLRERFSSPWGVCLTCPGLWVLTEGEVPV